MNIFFRIYFGISISVSISSCILNCVFVFFMSRPCSYSQNIHSRTNPCRRQLCSSSSWRELMTCRYVLHTCIYKLFHLNTGQLYWINCCDQNTFICVHVCSWRRVERSLKLLQSWFSVTFLIKPRWNLCLM